jgi:hypothetical protein
MRRKRRKSIRVAKCTKWMWRKRKNETALLCLHSFIVLNNVARPKKVTFPNDSGLKRINSPCNLSRAFSEGETPAGFAEHVTCIRQVPHSNLDMA